MKAICIDCERSVGPRQIAAVLGSSWKYGGGRSTICVCHRCYRERPIPLRPRPQPRVHPWRAEVRRYLHRVFPLETTDVDEYISEFEHQEGTAGWREWFHVPRRKSCLSYKRLVRDYDLYLEATLEDRMPPPPDPPFKELDNEAAIHY